MVQKEKSVKELIPGKKKFRVIGYVPNANIANSEQVQELKIVFVFV